MVGEKSMRSSLYFSFDAQQAAFLATVAVRGVHRREQPIRLDQPGFEVLVDVEDEDHVLGFEIAADGGVMSDASAENLFPGEVDDIAAGRVVGVAHLLAELFERQ